MATLWVTAIFGQKGGPVTLSRQDSLLTQHKTLTAEREITRRLRNKYPTKHNTVCPYEIYWAILLTNKLPMSWSRYFDPRQVKQLQIPLLIVFGQSVNTVRYNQMLKGSAACGFLCCYATIAKLLEAKCFLVKVQIVLFKIMLNSKEQLKGSVGDFTFYTFYQLDLGLQTLTCVLDELTNHTSPGV